MTCDICSLGSGKGIAAFPSERAYIDHAQRIEALLDSGKLRKARVHDDAGPFARERYVCNQCGQAWLLEVPDQAFRGGYSPVRG